MNLWPMPVRCAQQEGTASQRTEREDGVKDNRVREDGTHLRPLRGRGASYDAQGKHQPAQNAGQGEIHPLNPRIPDHEP